MNWTSSVLLFAGVAKSLKIGVVSDPHYNVNYDPTTASNNCKSSTTIAADVYAPIGRYGCDTGPEMFDIMLQRFSEAFGDVDVLLVPGDHVAHKVSATDSDPTG
jgi:hypothetical protein